MQSTKSSLPWSFWQGRNTIVRDNYFPFALRKESLWIKLEPQNDIKKIHVQSWISKWIVCRRILQSMCPLVFSHTDWCDCYLLFTCSLSFIPTCAIKRNVTDWTSVWHRDELPFLVLAFFSKVWFYLSGQASDCEMMIWKSARNQSFPWTLSCGVLQRCHNNTWF